jgi:hypothetical protein
MIIIVFLLLFPAGSLVETSDTAYIVRETKNRFFFVGFRLNERAS